MCFTGGRDQLRKFRFMQVKQTGQLKTNYPGLNLRCRMLLLPASSTPELDDRYADIVLLLCF